VLEPRLAPFDVVAYTRRIGDSQLLSHIRQQLVGHVQRISKEHAQVASRDHLKGEPAPVVVPPPGRDQLPVLVVEVKQPLQLHPRQRPEPAVVTTWSLRPTAVPTGAGPANRAQVEDNGAGGRQRLRALAPYSGP
jgi:hypothetical protein